MTEEVPHIKPLCPASIDAVTEDTTVTPKKIKPKSLCLRTSNHSVEVRARYLDTSSGSCHDYCKYGHKNLKESTSTFLSKQRKKMTENSKVLVVNQPLSPAKSIIKRATSLSTPGASNTKYNDIILRNGIGVIQLSSTVSKGKKKLSETSILLSPKPPFRRPLSGISRNVKDPKEVSRLKRYSSVENGEIKKPLNGIISDVKNETLIAGNAPCFEKEKGKQKSPVSLISQKKSLGPKKGKQKSPVSLISQKKSLGPKSDKNPKSKASKKLDGIPIPKEKPKRKMEVDYRHKRLGKKVGIEDKKDSADKLGFKRGKVLDVKKGNSAPRKLKFKPRKVISEDLNGKADAVVVGPKTELAKKMTNQKVGINIRLKRVGKVEGKKESPAYKLKFERGKVIDVQPKNTAPRRLKFKPRKVIVENINGEISRRNLKKVVGVNEVKGLDTEHLRVVLKHQKIEGKKDVQSLLNNVIEETATRLVGLRKSKVKALVGAFESLMSLPDATSSTTSAS